LVARKVAGPEKGTLAAAELQFHGGEYARLLSRLETAGVETNLQNEPESRDALNELLVWIRLRGFQG